MIDCLSDIRSLDDFSRVVANGDFARLIGFDLRLADDASSRAEGLLAAGDYSGALGIYRLLLLASPNDVDLLSQYAFCVHLSGDNAVSVYCAVKLMEYFPKDPRGYFIAGRVALSCMLRQAALCFMSAAKDLAEGDDSFEVVFRESSKVLDVLSLSSELGLS